MRLALGALLTLSLLAACGPSGRTRTSFRDAGLSLYSSAVFNPAHLAGTWTEIATFQRPFAGKCPGPGQAQFAPEGARLRVMLDLCMGGRREAFDGYADVTGPGRLTLSGANPRGLGQEWWILWADIDNRTLAIGTPSGDFGFVLDRTGQLPPDRLKAAQEIFEWGGYDLSKLTLFAGRAP